MTTVTPSSKITILTLRPPVTVRSAGTTPILSQPVNMPTPSAAVPTPRQSTTTPIQYPYQLPPSSQITIPIPKHKIMIIKYI